MAVGGVGKFSQHELGTQGLGDSKVYEFDHTFGCYQHVGRLDIAVNYQFLVSVVNSGTDGLEQLNALPD